MAIFIRQILIETILVFLYLIIHDAPNLNYGILPSYFATQETAAVVGGDHIRSVADVVCNLVRM